MDPGLSFVQTCFNDDPNDGVIWPCDKEYTNCPQDGVPVDYPTIFDDNCSLNTVFSLRFFNYICGGFFNQIMGNQNTFHFVQLHTVPTRFHLPVSSANKN